jgi:UDP-hydrolysing UDP-N-acetyl-D-glucosamine 2-epimerase
MARSQAPRRKICVVITARASYSRIRTALAAIQSHPDLTLQVVVGSSAVLERYGNAARHIEADGFPIDARIYNIVEGENLVTSAKSTGLALVELATVFNHLQPDAVVSIADRFETLATAVAAAYMNIPLVHVQGGEITGSIDEKVRHAVTKLADLHLVASQPAAERVIHMGEPRERVHVTGCPSIDLAHEVLQNPRLDFDPLAKYGGVGSAVDLSRGYLVVLQHPVTTEYRDSLVQVTETLYALKDSALPVLWFWPNVDAGSDATSKGIRRFRENEHPANFHFFKHMDSKDFLRLLVNSRGIIGNSSVAIRECSYLGVPAVNVGTRQEGRDRGRNVIDVPHDRRKIAAAVRKLLRQGRTPSDTLYGEGNAGARIADALATASLAIEKRLAFEKDPAFARSAKNAPELSKPAARKRKAA